MLLTLLAMFTPLMVLPESALGRFRLLLLIKVEVENLELTDILAL